MPILVTQDQKNQIDALFQVVGTGVDPIFLKNQATALVKARSTGQAGLTAAEQKFGDPGAVVKAYRALKRNDNIDVSSNGNILGVITFDAPNADPTFNTHDGTSNRQDFTRWLVQQPGGIAEIEISTSLGWRNCVNGQVNVEVALQDGTGEVLAT